VLGNIRVAGEWAYLGIHAEHLLPDKDGNVRPMAASGGLIVARKLNNSWQLAFAGDPHYRSWLEDMPDELLTPQQRRFFS
jgi:hypothetical protein